MQKRKVLKTDPRIGETQRGVQPACKKEAVYPCHCAQSAGQLAVENHRSNISENIHESPFYDFYTLTLNMLSACLFVFRRLRCCLIESP